MSPRRPRCGHSHSPARCFDSGVLETVRIRRQGFPYREAYPDFWSFCSRRGYVTMVPTAETAIVRADGKVHGASCPRAVVVAVVVPVM